MDRDQRHVWRRRAVVEARAGNLPPGAILTAEALLACMGADGALYPSQATLAAKAGVGTRSVARHIDRMVELGLLRRHRRLVRLPWPEGGRGATRVQQTSNAYELVFPTGHVLPRRPKPTGARRQPTPNTDCHSGREEAGRRINHLTTLDRAEAQKALEQVRLARTAALAAAWTGRREGGTQAAATILADYQPVPRATMPDRTPLPRQR